MTDEPGKPARSEGAPAGRDSEAMEESALFYALGALVSEEAREFEELASGDAAAAAEEAAWQDTLTQLGRAVGERSGSPPEGLRAKLMEKLSAQRRTGPSGISIVRGAEGAWQETGVPGVSLKQLNVDESRRYTTMLVRMEPGASYPSHRHGGLEECYVLEGDLRVGDHVLRAGDYQCAAAESLHAVQLTEGGCLLLVSASRDDELV